MVSDQASDNNGTCPLCQQSAFVQAVPAFLAHGVRCARCGVFLFTQGAFGGYEDQLHLISGATRRHSDARPPGDKPIVLTTNSIPHLLAGIPQNIRLLEQLDLMLSYMQGHQTRSDEFIEYGELMDTDYPLLFARDADEAFHFMRTLSDQGLLERPNNSAARRKGKHRITPAGWQRLRELDGTGQASNQAFVAMWFDPELEEAWSQGIQPALNALGYDPLRIDETHGDEPVNDRIVAEIRRSSLLVADFTGDRGGVYFEAGLAVGLGIPVVWTCRRSDFEKQKPHFDVDHYQFLLWETPGELRQQLVDHISARIPGRSFPRSNA